MASGARVKKKGGANQRQAEFYDREECNDSLFTRMNTTRRDVFVNDWSITLRW